MKLSCQALLVPSAAAVFVTVLSGCYVVPFPVSRSLPDLEAALPADLRSSDEDVLVLRRVSLYPSVVKDPLLMKGRDLHSLSQSERLESGWGVFTWIGVDAEVHTNTVYLHSVCLITAKGQEMEFRPTANEWAATDRGVVPLAKREALVLALRANVKQFEGDWPCGIYGELNWSDAARSLAIEFFERPAGSF
jgi:hypothetical protein